MRILETKPKSHGNGMAWKELGPEIPRGRKGLGALWGWGCGDHQRGSSVLLSGVMAVGAIPELTHTSHSLPSTHAMLIIWQMKTLGDVGKFMHMMETLAPPAGQIHQTLPEAALCVCVCVCVCVYT